MRTGKKVKRSKYLANLISLDELRLTDGNVFASQVGAAFSPMLQDLREYLEENPDNAVSPDWADAVRNSVRTERCLENLMLRF